MSYAIFYIKVIIVVMNMVIMAAAMALTARIATLTVGCYGNNGLHDFNCCNGYNFSRDSFDCIAFNDPNGSATGCSLRTDICNIHFIFYIILFLTVFL